MVATAVYYTFFKFYNYKLSNIPIYILFSYKRFPRLYKLNGKSYLKRKVNRNGKFSRITANRQTETNRPGFYIHCN